jgi:hypothetical protein
MLPRDAGHLSPHSLRHPRRHHRLTHRIRGTVFRLAHTQPGPQPPSPAPILRPQPPPLPRLAQVNGGVPVLRAGGHHGSDRAFRARLRRGPAPPAAAAADDRHRRRRRSGGGGGRGADILVQAIA